MKFARVEITKTRTAEGTRFTYPPEWDASKINVVAYEDNGGAVESCVCVIADDVYAATLIASTAATEVTQAGAETDARTYRGEPTIVNNEARVIVIVNKLLANTQAKNKMAAVLSTTEMNALDENSTEPGIIKKTFNIADHLPA